METKKYDCIIVGSGAGGATLARELSKKGQKVLVLEKGIHEHKFGTATSTMRFWAMNKFPKTLLTSKEGTVLLRAFMAGGSTFICCANGCRCLEEELSHFGITLDDEFAEAEQEMNLAPIAERLLSEASKKMIWAAGELGYEMKLMPKFINPKKCVKCGKCVYGCVQGAKWTALDYLMEAIENGSEVMYKSEVEEVIVENGQAKGIRGKAPNGKFELRSDLVVLAAGGLTTPVILQKSGIEDAGSGLFIDLHVQTYGITKNLCQLREPVMALVNDEFLNTKGFILSPIVSHDRGSLFSMVGLKGFFKPIDRIIGLMTKIVDEPAGRVYADGSVSKPVTARDQARLDEGVAISKEILIKMGASPKSIFVSKPMGSHTGGTAAIGKIVDKNLETEVKNLFVCDGSVLPEAPGLPPILTIVALAKRLAKNLTSSVN